MITFMKAEHTSTHKHRTAKGPSLAHTYLCNRAQCRQECQLSNWVFFAPDDKLEDVLDVLLIHPQAQLWRA